MDLTTTPGDEPRNLGEFIDYCLDRYMRSSGFRSALHRERPGETGRPQYDGICPPWHRHGESSHCYSTHKCRCDKCRAASSLSQKRTRTRRAQREWQRRNNEETRTA